MKYLSTAVFIWLFPSYVFGQDSPAEVFLNGKSVVLVSASPSASPAYSWENIGEEIHLSLVESGADPIAYYELEDVVLSEATQATFADSFTKRIVQSIVVVTRKQDGSFHLQVFPFSGDKNILRMGQSLSTTASTMEEFKDNVASLGRNQPTGNYLVLEVPEFPQSPTGTESSNTSYLKQAPLNLDVFKLGVVLTGASGESGFLTTFRHDLFGKSPEQREAEQNAEKQGLEEVFREVYTHQVEFLTETLSNQELIQSRIQFILMRIEGREGDIMQSMGVNIPPDTDVNRIVVKYYIKFLVRNELYIGSEWDASPNWKEALTAFLKQIVR
ncbi:NTPase [Lunatibacter salilacus]|uniref:NTPase n=1 Tax=Lunatibacter salilacus TaxID=2483804 RepID=UPI00131DAD22|nr:NTPase [Lunatibacter salilacus]